MAVKAFKKLVTNTIRAGSEATGKMGSKTMSGLGRLEKSIGASSGSPGLPSMASLIKKYPGRSPEDIKNFHKQFRRVYNFTGASGENLNNIMHKFAPAPISTARDSARKVMSKRRGTEKTTNVLGPQPEWINDLPNT